MMKVIGSATMPCLPICCRRASGSLCQQIAITTLHSRASQWYERNGFVIEAVNHALAAQDFEAAADLIQQNASKIMIRGELTTLLQWIEALPVDVSRRHPQIIISKAWSLTLAGAQPQVESLLREIEAQIEFSDDTPEARELRGNAAAIRGYFAMLAGDYARALAVDRTCRGSPA